eukprot:9867032-Alexandrium_andersonii.AAC.1
MPAFPAASRSTLRRPAGFSGSAARPRGPTPAVASSVSTLAVATRTQVGLASGCGGGAWAAA